MSKPEIFKQDLSDERLAIHLHACDSEGVGGDLAVDCEMMGLKPHRDRLCLVQISDAHKNISLIQIAPGQDSAPNLKKLLEHKNITKLFHFARTDVAYLSFYLDINTYPLFCTKIASKIARTYTDHHGLRGLVKEVMGIDLNKQQQSSDWGRDDLTKEQIEYAAGDVIYLIKLKEGMINMLEREGRMEIAERCFEQISLMSELDNLGYDYVFEHRVPKQP